MVKATYNVHVKYEDKTGWEKINKTGLTGNSIKFKKPKQSGVYSFTISMAHDGEELIFYSPISIKIE